MDTHTEQHSTRIDAGTEIGLNRIVCSCTDGYVTGDVPWREAPAAAAAHAATHENASTMSEANAAVVRTTAAELLPTSRLANMIESLTGVPAADVETDPLFGVHRGTCTHCGHTALVASLSFDGEPAATCCADCIWGA